MISLNQDQATKPSIEVVDKKNPGSQNLPGFFYLIRLAFCTIFRIQSGSPDLVTPG